MKKINISEHSSTCKVISLVIFLCGFIGGVIVKVRISDNSDFIDLEDLGTDLMIGIWVAMLVLALIFRGIAHILYNQEQAAAAFNSYIERQETVFINTDETEKMTVNAPNGVHYYSSLTSTSADGVIPCGNKLDVISKDNGTKTIKGVDYVMAKGIYDNKIVYVALEFLE